MPNNKRDVWTDRMLEAMDILIQKKIVETEKDFFLIIDFNYSNASQLKKGKQSFRVYHIVNCAYHFNIPTDFLLGLSDSKTWVKKIKRKAV